MTGSRRRLRLVARLLDREREPTHRATLAASAGALAGASPLYGLRTPFCVLLSIALGANRRIVCAVARLASGWTTAFLAFASIAVGESLRREPFGFRAGAPLMDGELGALLARLALSWLTGGLVLALTVSVVAGVATAVFHARRVPAGASSARARLDPYSLSPERQFGERIGGAIGRASRRYRRPSIPQSFRWYAAAKYRLDPSFGALAARIAPGSRVVDLGTGLAMLPVVLAELDLGCSCHGVEWDVAKARAASQVAEGLGGVVIETGDVRSAPIPECDVVVLADVLHYLRPEEQRELLARASAALAPGGRLLVRESDPSRRGWARWTRGAERAVIRLGWNVGRSVSYRSIAELRADLRELGFAVVVETLAGPLHPGNVLLTAERSGVLAVEPEPKSAELAFGPSRPA